jgi:hypothetical protein
MLLIIVIYYNQSQQCILNKLLKLPNDSIIKLILNIILLFMEIIIVVILKLFIKIFIIHKCIINVFLFEHNFVFIIFK